MEDIIGIICEYNPLHNGHLYHLQKIKEMYPDSTVILVIPGYFTQRGDFSILTKYDKVKLSLEMGIDLVIELPFVFATQSADIFAKGAIEILEKLNVQKLIFGSECNDITLLKNLVDYQNSSEYNIKVKKYLDEGINYPTALSKALKDHFHYELKSPNDLLGISYIKAIKELNSHIEPITIKRTSDYNSLKVDSDFVSASAIRNLINNHQNIDKYVPNNVLNYSFIYTDYNKYFKLLKYKIVSDSSILNKFQTVDEGIENRIMKVINECQSLDEFILKVKTKRYTYNKIKRMCLHILCSFTKEEASKFKNIEYIRLLGFNEKGKEYLSKQKKICTIPIVSKLSSLNNEMMELEKRVTNIYALITNQDLNKKEYQYFPIIF